MCPEEKIGIEDQSRQAVLLVEYQASQASAQHHDQLVWTATSIIWASNLVLLGFILKSPVTLMGMIVSLTLCLLGIILITFVWIAQAQWRFVRKQKYDRCKIIEEELGMKQHRETVWPVGSQTRIYRIIMILFVVAWTLVAVSIVLNFITYNNSNKDRMENCIISEIEYGILYRGGEKIYS